MATSTFNNPTSFGSYVPTTNVWDVNEILNANLDPKLTELLVRLYQNLNLIAMVINTKDTAYYDTNELVNGQLFFPNSSTQTTSFSSTLASYRQVYRKVINFGALPNTTTKSIAHGITVTKSTVFTRIYGTSTNAIAGEYIPLPYASATALNTVELFVTTTQVTIITSADYSAYTTTVVILEYVQS